MLTKNRALAAGSAVLITMVVGAVPATAVVQVAGRHDGGTGTQIGTAYTWQSAGSNGNDGTGQQVSPAMWQWYQDHPDDDVPGSWPGRWRGWPGRHPRPTATPTVAVPGTQPPSDPTADPSGYPTTDPSATPSATATMTDPIVTSTATPTDALSPTPTPSENPTPSSTPAPSSSGANGSYGSISSIKHRSGLPWVSGVFVPSNDPAEVEKFAAWRGRPVDVVVQWSARQTWDDIINPAYLYNAWKNTPYTMAFGVAPIPEGDPSATLALCAAGTYNDKWTTFGANIQAAGLGTSIIRLGWEFNGNWYRWQASNPTQFAQCYQQIVTSVRQTAPKLLWDWTVNRGTGQSVADARLAYPGDAYVDMVGVDAYDMWPGATTEAAWQTQYAGPYGLKFWADFAKQHGKKLSVPEWGVYPAAGQNGGDNAFYISKMEAFFAAEGSDLGYESYFNENAGYYGGAIYGPTENPKAAASYKAAVATGS